jgi:MYXO-CTERM domain-containing protein
LQAVPVDYTIYDTDTLETLGSLTVDPDLANPVGSSNVTLSALSLTEVLGVFGSVTISLADYTGGTMPHAGFEDGVIQSLSANTAFDVGGLLVGLDITPAGPDLSFVGILQFLADPLGENEIGPVRGIGITPVSVPVPEPMALPLAAAALLLAAAMRRRRPVSS